MLSEKNELRRTKKRVECCGGELKRSNSSPSLRTLNEATWTKGRGKGGRKLGVGGGLAKNMPEKGFAEWTKLHKESVARMIKKRNEVDLSKSLGNSPALTKTRKRNIGKR